MKLYAGFIMAKSNDGMAVQSIAILANNKTEALGKVLENSRKSFPQESGYTMHTGDVTEVPQDLIHRAIEYGAS